MAPLQPLLKDVLAEITPSKEEIRQTLKNTSSLIATLNKSLRRIGARALLGGSFRKNTQLKRTFDVDIFVLFNYQKYAKDDKALSDLLEKELRKHFPSVVRLHGSRDYFQMEHKPYTFELIPILDVRLAKQAKNITDVSPLHARWVARKGKGKGKENEIRLTKAFLASAGIYGAESYVRGFSGYACEVLTIHYGSFLNLLQAVRKWKSKQVIDPERYYRPGQAILMLNKSKTLSPLVLVDPVQSTRNVTASLSEDAYALLRKKAALFLRAPSKVFFASRQVTKSELIASSQSSRKNILLLVELVPKRGKRDVMGAVVMTRYDLLKKKLVAFGFSIVKTGCTFGDESSLLWFFISSDFPSPTELREGPFASDAGNAARFRKKHKAAVLKAGRWYAQVKRRFATPQALVRSLVQENSFKGKLVSVNIEWH